MTDTENAEWVRVSVIGDQWDVEFDANSQCERYRHRPQRFDGQGFEYDWMPGRPDSGIHAKKEV